jgi:hypothetical protein
MRLAVAAGRASSEANLVANKLVGFFSEWSMKTDKTD